ncbi:MAG: leucine-rich repeat domain-containing protein [Clostridia bacterium]|nr:leucine-rich repeat domain-containing protein [Clostridia bacterium]
MECFVLSPPKNSTETASENTDIKRYDHISELCRRYEITSGDAKAALTELSGLAIGFTDSEEGTRYNSKVTLSVDRNDDRKLFVYHIDRLLDGVFIDNTEKELIGGAITMISSDTSLADSCSELTDGIVKLLYSCMKYIYPMLITKGYHGKRRMITETVGHLLGVLLHCDTERHAYILAIHSDPTDTELMQAVNKWGDMSETDRIAVSVIARMNPKHLTVSPGITAIKEDMIPKSIENAVIPEGVTEINEDAFCFCRALKSITLPSSLLKIENRAFMGCSALTRITLPDNLTHIGKEAFAYCSDLAEVLFPDCLENIGEYAFCDCYSLADIRLPGFIQRIGDGAFQNCVSLRRAILPYGIKALPKELFEKCCSLEDITLPDELTAIGSKAFSECVALTQIALPQYTETIDEDAFFACSSLSQVQLPPSLKHIGKSAFAQCASLDTVLYRGDNLSWKKITKSKSWNSECGKYTLIFINSKK